MYLNLFHNGKKYSYETNNKLNMGHLKELSEKILNSSDKNIMHIIYNNNKYGFPDDKISLKDLIPKGKNKTSFSIKVDENKTPKQKYQSFEEAIKSNDIKKNIFQNYYSGKLCNNKKFNNSLTYKYNEFLIEIKEFFKRINEIYQKLILSYLETNMKCKDKYKINKKLKEISEYEYHMIQFAENEKNYFRNLNAMVNKCVQMKNNKILISNTNLQELYKEMSIDKLLPDYKNNNSNILYKTRTILGKTRNKLLFEESSIDKTNKKEIFPLLSYDNNNENNNEIIGSKNNKMMISTELGADGVQRGKIILFPSENKKKQSLFGLKKNSNKKNNENEKENDENMDDAEKSLKLKLIKNRLIFRNNKSKFNNNIFFKTKEERLKNKNLVRNFSSECLFEEKDKSKILNKIRQDGKNEYNNLNNNNIDPNNNNSKNRINENINNNDVNNNNINNNNFKNTSNSSKNIVHKIKTLNGNLNINKNITFKNEFNKSIIPDNKILKNYNNGENNIIKKKKNILSLFYKDPNKKINETDEEDSSEKEDDEKNKKNNSKKRIKKVRRNDSDESEKEDDKNNLDDIQLLRSLLDEKDNPYKNGNELNSYDFDIQSEDEDIKLRKRRKKEKQMIQNDYHFII